MNPTVAWILITSPLGGLSSCTTPFPHYTAAPELEWKGRFAEAPAGTRMTTRAILTFRGMELPWTMQVLRRMPDDIRMIVLDDLGGSPLHVLIKNGSTTILNRSELLPEAFVRDGLCRDLATWLLAAPRADDLLVLREDGTPALVRTESTGRTMYWSMSPGGRVDHIATESDDGLQTELELQWDEAQPEPSGASIVNHRFGYSLEVEVRQSARSELTDEHFRIER